MSSNLEMLVLEYSVRDNETCETTAFGEGNKASTFVPSRIVEDSTLLD